MLRLQSAKHVLQPTDSSQRQKAQTGITFKASQPICPKSTHRHEDLDTLTDILDQNDYFTMFDLVSAYYLISIHTEFSKYLVF